MKEKKKRAAAYCRVSTDLEMQEGSFLWQKKYYTELLKKLPGIELIEIYGDEGRSGRSIRRRPEFLRMIKDCEAGKIDLIYTKSISRFSRNLPDCVEAVRHLKELGIAVIFEKENINTMDSKGELLLHILATIAQEESNSIGQNVKWGIDKSHAAGKPTGKVAYGYRRIDQEGHWQIEETEARRVRYAFFQAADGACYRDIRVGLEQMEEREQTGVSWIKNRNRLPMLLKNVVYTGDYVTDTYYSAYSKNGHRYSRKNRGERDRFYLENHHDAIVDRELFEKVQAMIRLGLLRSDRKPYRKKKEHSGG